MDGGSLNQLRNLINRRNVTKDPTKNFTANEEFFDLVTDAHILCAAMKVLNMKTLDDTPSTEFFPSNAMELDSLQRRNILLKAVRGSVYQLVRLSRRNWIISRH